MKSKFFMFLFLVLLFPSINSYALKPDEIAIRNVCSNIELAIAKEDGSLESVSCHDSYQEAKDIMNQTENDDLVIIEGGMIIDAKYALIDYDVSFKNTNKAYVEIFENTTSNTEINYIRAADNYGDDAVLLDFDYDTGRVKIKVAGITGWIKKYDNGIKRYHIVPTIWATSPQYYKITENSIIHYLPGNIYGEKGSISYIIDSKPEMLEVGNYYSYDGHYLYNDLKTLINDYKNNNYDNSINKDKPYYNYYQYLSFRTKTNYNADNINEYIERHTSNKNSLLKNTGAYFIWVQDNYGINPILMLSIGINESGWGNSDIAKRTNNLFGLNAVDKTPGESASYFPTVEACIKDYGYVWLSYWYLQPGDWHYTGANLGDKYEGLNNKYASDPFWSEKAASYYYDLDKDFDFQDKNSYTIAVLNNEYNDTVYALKQVDGEKVRIYSGNKFYQYNLKGTPVAVIEELEGPSVNDNNIWYKIQSEPVLDNDLNYIGSSSSKPRYNYNWNAYLYVPAAYFIKVSNGLDSHTNENYVWNLPVEEPTTPNEEVNNENIQDDNNNQEPIPEVVIKPVTNIVNDASYRYENGIISRISLGTNFDSIKSNLLNQGATDVKITDINGNSKDGILATGDKIVITNTSLTETMEVVIYGDINSDGIIDKTDCSEILRQYYGYVNYDGVKKIALDVNRDGVIDKVDASFVLRQFYGYGDIEQ